MTTLHLEASGYGIGIAVDFTPPDTHDLTPAVAEEYRRERRAAGRILLDVARLFGVVPAPAAPGNLDGIDPRRIADAVVEASRNAGPTPIRVAPRPNDIGGTNGHTIVTDRLGERIESAEELITKWSAMTATLAEETAATLNHLRDRVEQLEAPTAGLSAVRGLVDNLHERLAALEVTADHNPPELAALIDALSVELWRAINGTKTIAEEAHLQGRKAAGIAEGLQRRQVATANALRVEVYRVDGIEGRLATIEGNPPAKPIPGAVPTARDTPHPILSDLVRAAQHVLRSDVKTIDPETCSDCRLALDENMLVATYDHGIAEPAGYVAGPRAVELAALETGDEDPRTEEPNIGQHTAGSYADLASPFDLGDPVVHISGHRGTVRAILPDGRVRYAGAGFGQDWIHPADQLVHDDTDDLDEDDVEALAAEIEPLTAEVDPSSEEENTRKEIPVDVTPAPTEDPSAVTKAGIDPDEVRLIVDEFTALGQPITGRAVADALHLPARMAGPIGAMLDRRGWR